MQFPEKVFDNLVPEEIMTLQDLAELFLEIQDTDSQRPDFSLVNSNTRLTKLYSISKRKDSRKTSPEEPKEPKSFSLLSRDTGNM